jgi:aspartyl-tRNA(Asn)/glutamyl-tRNA(Gln) amidotransferase subunit B
MKLTIGLEIHAQLNTKSKLFSKSKAEGCGEPNKNTSCFDLAIPGTLPLLNQEVIEKAIMATISIDGQINKYSRFDRKHYFYPDSPLNYQITQFYRPICIGGFIDIGTKKINIDHFHIETDAGKMLHIGKNSYLDFNRVGVPLIEIVTKPEIESVEDFKKFLNELILRLQYTEVCDCNMEKGNFRIDTNISVSNSSKLGTRVEIKNLNSIKFAIEAINYEFSRQVELISSGQNVLQETRGYDSEAGKTFLMRSKEDILDYRYIPEFNIAPIEIDDEFIENVRRKMPELPNERRQRYEFLNDEVREVLIADKKLGEMFDDSAGEIFDASFLANLIASDLMGICKKDGILPYESKVTPDFLNKIAKMFAKSKISSKIAKILVEKVYISGKDPEKIVEDEGLIKITDPAAIEKVAREIISENFDEVERYRKGDEKLLMFFLGKVMKKTSNRIDPVIGQMILKDLLNK